MIQPMIRITRAARMLGSQIDSAFKNELKMVCMGFLLSHSDRVGYGSFKQIRQVRTMLFEVGNRVLGSLCT